ncbi:MAG: hypothetical protein ABIE47_06925 [Pseudomonadota bacterium]
MGRTWEKRREKRGDYAKGQVAIFALYVVAGIAYFMPTVFRLSPPIRNGPAHR